MKIRTGFVSNSSSTSFIIQNKTKEPLTVRDFAEENIHLLEEFNKEYRCDYKKEDFLKSASRRSEIILPGKNNLTFGDEEGTVIGTVFDYMLRYGDESKRFKWRVYKYNR